MVWKDTCPAKQEKINSGAVLALSKVMISEDCWLSLNCQWKLYIPI